MGIIEKEKNMAEKKNVKLFLELFFGTILIHWLVVILSYWLLGEDGNIFVDFYNKFTETGDTPHYMYIAENWYASSGEKANLIVFYPLFPLLMKIVGFIVRDYFVAGVLISNVCMGISGYYMYRLAKEELGASKAMDSFIIYALYPFGAFMVLVFTEGLSMMLVIMCLYYIRKKKWAVAGVLGLLASLSKSQGIALLVPAVYEAIIYMKNKKKFDIKTLSVFLIPCGTLMYLLINKLVLGDFLAFAKYESEAPWYNTSNWIADNISQQFGMGMTNYTLALEIYWIQIFLYFALIILLLYGLKKKVPASLIAFGGAHIFLSFLHGWLISGPRYMMGCVTMYIVYAVIDNKYVKGIIALLFGLLAVFYTVGLWQGQAIM